MICMSDVLKIRDEYRQVQWAAAIQECKASRLTNKEASHKDHGRTTGAGTPERISGTARGAAHSIPWGGTNASGAGRYGCGNGASALHSVTMIDLAKVRNYYIACGYTDLI